MLCAASRLLASKETIMKKIIVAGLAVAGALFAGLAVSHSGGLDKFGCHKDSTTGVYHCHK